MKSSVVALVVCGLLAATYMRDCAVPSASQGVAADAAPAVDDAAEANVPDSDAFAPGQHHVLVQFCTQCACHGPGRHVWVCVQCKPLSSLHMPGSYKRNFVQLKQWLETEFPETIGQIEGRNYPPPPMKQLLVSLVSYGQIAAVVLVIFGQRVFSMAGMTTPAWVDWMQQNKMACVVGFFLLANVAAQMTATGAFEISYNGAPVFSKLDTGRLPTLDELRGSFEDAGLAPPDLDSDFLHA